MIRVNRLVGSFFRRVSIKRLLVPPLHLWLVTLLLVAVIGVGGSVAGWQAVLNDQDSALHQRFESLAQDRAAAIQQEVNGSLQELYALRALFEEQTTVSRSSFRAFVDELPATRALQAVEWIPQVPAGERSQYEAAARADGFPSFQITEHNAGGQLVAAGARSEYYPVYYAEPTQGNLAALGFDLASEPTRRSALLQALNTGQPATTTGIRLVQETGSQWGVLIYLPVLRADVARTSASPPGANLEGFVLGVIRTGDLVETSLSHLTPGGIDVALWDTSDPSAKEPLSVHWSRTRQGEAGPAAAWTDPGPNNLVSRLPISVGDRTWTVEARPAPALLAGYGDWWAWLVLGVGLVLTGLAIGYLLLLRRRSRETREFALASVTAKENLEREVAAKKGVEQQLWQSQKLEALGQLAGGIAHDLNNLLTPIMGYSDLISGNALADEASKADAAEIKRTAESAASITKRLLTFSRRDGAQPQALDLNRSLIAMRQMLASLLGEEIEVQTALSPAALVVEIDPSQFEQVVINLALNARDAMDSTGRLSITTAPGSVTEADASSGLPSGEYAILTVADTGSGMDAETFVRAFEPFFTTKAVGKGTGLGLSVVYGIVKQAGGTVAIKSRPHEGTQVEVHLPLSKHEPAERGPGKETPAIEKRKDKGTVLILEDDAAVRAIAGRVLSQRGFAVLAASTPSEAYALAAEADVDLLLTDLHLPEESGCKVAAKMGLEKPNMKILVMSGYFEEHRPGLTACAGKWQFLEKPFTPESLIAAVEKELSAAGA